MKRLTEGIKEKSLEDFISKTIKGTEWEGKVFIAGGYVRDEFMGKDPKDLDLLVNSPNGGIEFAKWITKKVGAYKGTEDLPPMPKVNYTSVGLQNPEPATDEDWEKIEAWQAEVNRITSKTGSNPVIFPRFGTAKFNLRGVIHNGIDLSDMDIEAVMPRKEQYTAGSRKPTVTGGELKDDVERRDFTVNSLLKDLSTGEILDLTGLGKADIKAGIIRTPLNPDKIFTDDPLRMLRAIRFAVKYNWKLPLFMVRGLKKNASQLQNISQERIRDELNKMLVTGYPQKAIQLMKITGLLSYVIPELIPLVKLRQNQYHKDDAFKHTLDVLSKTQPILIQRLMGLFHDIGKAATHSVTPTGVHFYGHEDEGAEIATAVMRRLKYPTELINAVVAGVKNHMRFKRGGDEANVSDRTLRSFIRDLGDNLQDTLELIHADNIAHSEAASMPHQISNIRDRLKTLEMNPTNKGKLQLPINGKDLLQLGVPQGELIGKIKGVIEKAVLKNPKLTREEAIKIAARMMKYYISRRSLKESSVIKEAYDLPPELERNAKNVTLAAIGWIYSPHFLSKYNQLKTAESKNKKIMDGIRKFPKVVKLFMQKAKPGDKKEFILPFVDFFSWENSSKHIQNLKVTISKDRANVTKVTTKPRYNELEGWFYTYGDWSEPQEDDPEIYYKRKILDQYEESLKYFYDVKHEYIVNYLGSYKKCEEYKKLATPHQITKYPQRQTGKIKLDDEYSYVASFAVKVEGKEYFYYFNNVPTYKDSKRLVYPDYESEKDDIPYVYMTLIKDDLAHTYLDEESVKRKVLTAKHEAIHLYQSIKKSDITTGLPKKVLLHKFNPSVRGTSTSGAASADSPYKDPEDIYGRVTHSHRDVEFKSNLLNIVDDFKKVLNKNFPKTQWKDGFRLLIKDISDKMDYEERKKFKEIFKFSFSWENSIARKNLKHLLSVDYPKFKQYIKEIYKLLFINSREEI